MSNFEKEVARMKTIMGLIKEAEQNSPDTKEEELVSQFTEFLDQLTLQDTENFGRKIRAIIDANVETKIPKLDETSSILAILEKMKLMDQTRKINESEIRKSELLKLAGLHRQSMENLFKEKNVLAEKLADMMPNEEVKACEIDEEVKASECNVENEVKDCEVKECNDTDCEVTISKTDEEKIIEMEKQLETIKSKLLEIGINI